jgi:hypothetical protein
MFLIDLTFILPKLNEEDEGVARLELKVQVARTSKIPRARFWHAPIDLDKEMEDVEEVGGTSTQPKSSQRLDILPTLLSMLKSWNLGRLCFRNPIMSPRKHTLTQQSLKALSLEKKGRT